MAETSERTILWQESAPVGEFAPVDNEQHVHESLKDDRTVEAIWNMTGGAESPTQMAKAQNPQKSKKRLQSQCSVQIY